MGGFLSQIARRSFSRRLPWLWCLAVAALFVTIVRLSFFEELDVTSWLPSTLRPSPAPVLRPFDYIDTSRIRSGPDNDEGNDVMDEQDGIGTLHDKRNPKFYEGGTLTLTSQDDDASSPPKPAVYDPYPAYNSKQWRAAWKGDFRPCKGPRGKNLDRRRSEDMVLVYRGNQKGFPFPMFGSHEALELDGNVCADRCTRWGAYGFKEVENNKIGGCHTPKQITWEQVNWGALQNQCSDRNANRYWTHRDTIPSVLSFPSPAPAFSKSVAQDIDDLHRSSSSSSSEPASPSEQKFHSRTAVLVRSWHSMEWTANHIHYLRSMIMELSLHSGGEYTVFLLVDVKDSVFNLSSTADIARLKAEFIPTEFHNITIFFNAPILEAWYPGVPEHSANLQHLQPTQIFSQLHPGFDYVWQFEMDARITGHVYHFLSQSIAFAKSQARKYLWERNAYFYAPGAHGSWADFVGMVHRSMLGKEEESVWGPVRVEGVRPAGPHPPTMTAAEDDYEWGVGEEADLITFLPIFSAKDTKWTFPDKIWGVPDDLPRRASPITMWRLSRKLLGVMHNELTTNNRSVVSEMSGPTWAMLHGFKAVHVPHPMFVDGQWNAKELARIYNPGRPAMVNGGNDSVWNWDHKFDHIMYRISYMFTTQTAEDLVRRWLGYPMEENQHSDGKTHMDAQGRWWFDEGELQEGKYGRLCFPPMFVHTVKNTAAQKGSGMAVPV